MSESRMERDASDGRRYDLTGVGSLRRPKWYSRRAEATSLRGSRWTFAEEGWFGAHRRARDEHGQEVGYFRWRGVIARGGDLRWAGETYRLAIGSWKGDGVLSLRGQELLTTRPGGWNTRRSTVRIDPGAQLDPGLVLFVVWLIQTERERRAAASSSSAGS